MEVDMYNNNDALTINAIRALSIDAIEKANSGHPGLPLGAAPFAYVLWAKNMMHNPKNPTWFNRDRLCSLQDMDPLSCIPCCIWLDTDFPWKN